MQIKDKEAHYTQQAMWYYSANEVAIILSSADWVYKEQDCNAIDLPVGISVTAKEVAWHVDQKLLAEVGERFEEVSAQMNSEKLRRKHVNNLVAILAADKIAKFVLRHSGETYYGTFFITLPLGV
jgi:hypothetical protein